MSKLIEKVVRFGSDSIAFEYFSGWATSLSAYEEYWTLEFSFFKVVIDLTDAGHG